MARQLKDWALLGSASNTSVLLRVFNRADALAGSFTVTPGTTAKMISDCSWGGSGWSEDFASAEVISIANGSVYAAPVKDPTILTSSSGALLSANFNLGNIPLGEATDPPPDN